MPRLFDNMTRIVGNVKFDEYALVYILLYILYIFIYVYKHILVCRKIYIGCILLSVVFLNLRTIYYMSSWILYLIYIH